MSRGKREAVKPRRSPEKNRGTSKKTNPGRILLIAAAALSAAVLLTVGAWKLLVPTPDVAAPPEQTPLPGAEGAIQPGGTSGSVEEPVVTKTRKEEYFTFLLIGKDTSSGSTDTMILVSYDVPNGQVNMMSIPRDTVVNVPWAVKKINSVYSASEESGGGLENLKRQVASLTGVMPDFYAVIEWKAVGRIVDAVGGVDFHVPRNMNYDDPYQDLHIHLTKGRQTLNGQQAMAMLRYRTDNDKSVGYGEPGRTETQRNFLKAMAGEVLQLGNITRIGSFVEIFMENVKTDMKLSDLMWFASRALSVDLSTMNSSTMPYIDVGVYRGGYYFMADVEGILPLVNEQFNPYEEEMTQADLRIVTRREDGSCHVPGGELLDENWAEPYTGSMREEAGGGEETVLVGSNVSGGTPAEEYEQEADEQQAGAETEGESEPPSEESGESPGEPEQDTPTGEEDTPIGEEVSPAPEGEGDPSVPPVDGEGTTSSGETDVNEENGEADGESEMPDWLN